MANRGRPRKDNADKLRTVSISVTPLQLQILEQICTMNDMSRSEVLRGLIEGAGYLECGIVGGVEPHLLQYQKYKLKKTGLMVCNPYTGKGFCKSSACEAAYKKEGLI